VNGQLLELSERRAALVARAAAERTQLADCCRKFENPARLFDGAVGLVKVLTSPLVGAAVSTLVANRRFRTWSSIVQLLAKGWRFFFMAGQSKK
jgi:hypothetical protein